MDSKLYSLAMFALKNGDPAMQLVAKGVFDDWALKGCVKARMIKGMMYFADWKKSNKMIHLHAALDELRKLPLYYIFENLPKFCDGEEAMQMLLPTPPERKRKSEDAPPHAPGQKQKGEDAPPHAPGQKQKGEDN